MNNGKINDSLWSMATRPLSSINEGEHNGWEKLTGKQGKTVTKNGWPYFDTFIVTNPWGPYSDLVSGTFTFYDNFSV